MHPGVSEDSHWRAADRINPVIQPHIAAVTDVLHLNTELLTEVPLKDDNTTTYSKQPIFLPTHHLFDSPDVLRTSSSFLRGHTEGVLL